MATRATPPKAEGTSPLRPRWAPGCGPRHADPGAAAQCGERSCGAGRAGEGACSGVGTSLPDAVSTVMTQPQNPRQVPKPTFAWGGRASASWGAGWGARLRMKVSPTPKERLPKIRSWKHNPNPPPPAQVTQKVT